jgi:hypothetical protein
LILHRLDALLQMFSRKYSPYIFLQKEEPNRYAVKLPIDKGITSPLGETWLAFFPDILQTLVVSKQFSFFMFVDQVLEGL